MKRYLIILFIFSIFSTLILHALQVHAETPDCQLPARPVHLQPVLVSFSETLGT